MIIVGMGVLMDAGIGVLVGDGKAGTAVVGTGVFGTVVVGNKVQADKARIMLSRSDKTIFLDMANSFLPIQWNN